MEDRLVLKSNRRLSAEEMHSKSMIGKLKLKLASILQYCSAFSANGRRLIILAALMHLTLAAGLFSAGRAGIAPSLIDRDGIMSSFAFDSYEYQHGAMRLAAVLKQDGIRTWIAEHEPFHVKVLSIQFVILGPLFGYSTLSGEPLNLFCYLAILVLVFMLGREVGGRRVGLFSAMTVALWPTFLLHTTQFLKDPLFIFAALAFVLCLTAWLTRTYSRSVAISTTVLVILTILLLLTIRFNFGIFIFALLSFAFVFLMVRQFIERRLLYWNMLCPLLALLVTGLLMFPLYGIHNIQRFKQYPSDQGGQSKAIAPVGAEQIPAVVSYPSRLTKRVPQASTEQLCAVADQAARRVSSARSRFSGSYTESGSNLDNEVEFKSFSDLMLYMPRAFEIGFGAPFPNMWVAAGKRVRNAGRLLSGAETFLIYLCELLVVFALLRGPRDLASGLLLVIITFGVTALALAVSNVGTLYRFRYTFWILLIILGMKYLEGLVPSLQRRIPALPTRMTGELT